MAAHHWNFLFILLLSRASWSWLRSRIFTFTISFTYLFGCWRNHVLLHGLLRHNLLRDFLRSFILLSRLLGYTLFNWGFFSLRRFKLLLLIFFLRFLLLRLFLPFFHRFFPRVKSLLFWQREFFSVFSRPLRIILVQIVIVLVLITLISSSTRLPIFSVSPQIMTFFVLVLIFIFVLVGLLNQIKIVIVSIVFITTLIVAGMHRLLAILRIFFGPFSTLLPIEDIWSPTSSSLTSTTILGLVILSFKALLLPT